MSDFKYLFTPIKVGNVELKNRISMSCLTNDYDRGSDQDCAFYEARARGGAALIGLACALTIPVNLGGPGFTTVGTPEGRDAYRRVIDAIHRGGAKAYIQVFSILSGQANKQIPCDAFGGQPHTSTTQEVETFIADSINAAALAKEVGADGIEYVSSQGHTIERFLSAAYNERDDEFGGDKEQRANIVLRIVDGARELVGGDFMIGYQVTMDETITGGASLDEQVDLWAYIVDNTSLDWVRPFANNYKPTRNDFQYPNSYMPQGINMTASAAFRAAVGNKCVVFGSHGVRTAELAEECIAEGYCDMVAMGRALIADPELPNKARLGQSDLINGCIGCAEGCYQMHEDGLPISCTINPEVGLEYLNQIQPTSSPKKVLVVGGGAAGMEAALVAAQIGHTVTLVEKDDALGGLVRIHAALPGLSDRGDFIRHMENELERAGVEVRKGEEMDADDIKGFGADVVLLATGAEYAKTGRARARIAPIEGAMEAENVLTPEDVILRDAEVGQHVVVYDTMGYEVGPGLAEMLADQGKDVDFVTPDFCMGRRLLSNGVYSTLATRVAPKVNYVRDTSIVSIDGDTVGTSNFYTFEPDEIDNVDTVILVTSRPPHDELYHELEGEIDIRLIGDAENAQSDSRCTYYAMVSGRNAALAV